MLHSDELAIHYHSINTVFSVTSSVGTTSSLVATEKRMKERTTDDACYNNTYLKRYPMSYETPGGKIDGKVNLRDCHLVLMLDNLVRLKYHDDPNPGESRSRQMCTLPITLQGLSKDSIEVEEWHDPAICDDNEKCSCKKVKSLSKADLNLLTDLLPEEENAIRSFKKFCIWGSQAVWKHIHENSVWQYIENKEEKCESTTSTNVVSNTGEKSRNEHEETESPFNNFPDIDIEELYENFTDNNSITDDEEENLMDLINEVECIGLVEQNSKCTTDVQEKTDIEGINRLDTSLLEQSMEALSIEGNDVERTSQDMAFEEDLSPVLNEDQELSIGGTLVNFGLPIYHSPSLLCRHPPPAIGRDGDINKLKEILDDVLIKTGHESCSGSCVNHNRILIGAHHKIGKNLLKLIRSGRKYEHYIAEFPLLHLRKSKINTLFAAYKDAGLLQLLKFTRDDDMKEWSKLISATHIDIATRKIRRLSMAFHLAFLIQFIHSLNTSDVEEINMDLQNKNAHIVCEKWNERHDVFVKEGIGKNATFVGYDLLLAAVKSSLGFSFLNGASSYAPFCTELLYEHYRAGPFYTKMKKTLYSTPIGKSTVNFATDTKREMNHQTALKGFRSGSTLNSVTCRMSLIDTLNEIHDKRREMRSEGINSEEEDDLGMTISGTDLKHVYPTAALILLRGGLTLESSDVPLNVYNKEFTTLPLAILDANTDQIEKYLIHRYVVKQELFNTTPSDHPDFKLVQGPRCLLSRVKRSTGVTVKRSTKKAIKIQKNERQVKEEERQRRMKKEICQTDCLSSDMNMCQALLKPDCTKPKVQKATGMKKAILNLLLHCKQTTDLNINDLVKISVDSVSLSISNDVRAASIEFAGVKFKTNACLGAEYMHYVQNSILKASLHQFANIKRLVLSEEKYKFTPDNFKAATREQRQQKESSSKPHLKSADSVLSLTSFDKKAIVSTAEGKSMVSTYLAANASHLSINHDFTIDIDSELHLEQCACDGDCNCEEKFTTRIQCTFIKGHSISYCGENRWH